MIAILATPWFNALMLTLPSLAAKLIAIWHTQGKITDQEIADFMSAQWADPESFFHGKPAMAVAPGTPSKVLPDVEIER